MVLRRISVFSGDFTLEAVDFVISDDPRLCNHVVDHVAELVTKSLVVADMGDAEPRLRLLETTRAYALSKLIESGEFDAIAPRYAEHISDSLQAAAQSNEGVITRKPNFHRKSISPVRRARIAKFQQLNSPDRAIPS
jgi:predicted ATPase